jgi:lysophospholipase L1-like esterase
MKKKKQINWLAVIIWIVMMFVLIEITLRFFIAPSVWPNKVVVESQYEKLLYELKPNNHVVFEGGLYKIRPTHIDTNADGLRDREYPLTKSGKRIAVIGDSMVFGQAAELNETFVKVMERKLGYDVINFGVPGYTTIQEREFYSAKVRKYDPDIVLLLFIANDFTQPLNYAQSDPLRSILRHVYIARFLYYQYYLYNYYSGLQPQLNSEDPWTKANLDALRELSKDVARDNKEFIVLLYPPVGDDTYYESYRAEIETIAKQEGFDLIAPRIFSHEDPLALSVRNEGHPTPYAHELYANAVLEELSKRGIVG